MVGRGAKGNKNHLSPSPMICAGREQNAYRNKVLAANWKLSTESYWLSENLLMDYSLWSWQWVACLLSVYWFWAVFGTEWHWQGAEWKLLCTDSLLNIYWFSQLIWAKDIQGKVPQLLPHIFPHPSPFPGPMLQLAESSLSPDNKRKTEEVWYMLSLWQNFQTGVVHCKSMGIIFRRCGTL